MFRLGRKSPLQQVLLILFYVLSSDVSAFQASCNKDANMRRLGRCPSALASSLSTEADGKQKVHFVFAGGGIFFYWQAGVVTYLTEKGYDLTGTSSCGASAGALTATLAANQVDFYKATELALGLAKDAGVWDRSGGLAGIWGPMIKTWLDDLLPTNCVGNVHDRNLSLLVTPIPSFGKDRIKEFKSKEDLIACNMASVHLPLFLDGKWTSNLRNAPYMDGSFLSSPGDYACDDDPTGTTTTLLLDYSEDPKYKDKSLLNAVEALSPDGIYQLLEDGKRYAKQMEEEGKFACLANSK